MLLISHRGNVYGPRKDKENTPLYVQDALQLGYDVEIDIWHDKDTDLYLGHNFPQYKVTLDWLNQFNTKLWLHCKNVNALLFFREFVKKKDFNFFWHEEDTVTLTSKGYIWAYPGKQPIRGSIAVLPERNNEDVETCEGVCSDYINKYLL